MTAQAAGIDLPLRALVCQDAHGATWLGDIDPGRAATRHGIGTDAAAVHQAMAETLAATASAATDNVASGGS